MVAMTSEAPFIHKVTPRMPWPEYRRAPGISITRLKELDRSPRHYQYRLTAPKESAALTLGTATHMAVLEPERFETEYAVWGERTDSGRMKPRKGAAWDAFVAAAGKRAILTEEDQIAACAIRDAVRSTPQAMRYLAEGEPEVSMQWAIDGRPCKGRLDWLTRIDGEPVLVGLKTARDCRPRLFASQAAKLGYHLQWAFYFDGYVAITEEVPRVVEIVVESAAPYDVAVYDVQADVIDQGRVDYCALIDTLTECERRGEWPGAVPEETPMILPAWAYDSEDDIAELGLEGFNDG